MCLVHALNNLVGGPLFDRPSKFIRLYADRTHQSYEKAREEIFTRGANLKNLEFIFYNREEENWYGLACAAVFNCDDISQIIRENMTIFEKIAQMPHNRVLFAYRDNPQNIDPMDPNSLVDSHIAVLWRKGTQWFLLDSSMDKKRNVTQSRKGSLQYQQHLNQVVLYVPSLQTPEKKY
jgi:hypothetical protein